MDGATRVAVMVEGPYSTQDLPKESPKQLSGVHLTLSPITNPKEGVNGLLQDAFQLLHEKFKPSCVRSKPLKSYCRPACHIYCICVECRCSAPLKFAVRSSRTSLNTLRQLLTEDLTLVCPACYQKDGQ